MTREWGNTFPTMYSSSVGKFEIDHRMAMMRAAEEFLRQHSDVTEFSIRTEVHHNIFNGDEWATLITFEE